MAWRLAGEFFANGASGTLAVADPGVEPGAELRQMDGSGERVVGAERERGGRRLGVRGTDEHHDRG